MDYDGYRAVTRALSEYGNLVAITEPQREGDDMPFVSIKINGLDPARVLNTLARSGFLEEPEPRRRQRVRPILEPVFGYAGHLVFRDTASAPPGPRSGPINY